MSKVIKERKKEKKMEERKEAQEALTSNRVNTPKHITQLHKLITQ